MDDGRQPIAIDHLSDSEDIEIIYSSRQNVLTYIEWLSWNRILDR